MTAFLSSLKYSWSLPDIMFVQRADDEYNPNQPRKPKGDPDGGKWTPVITSAGELAKPIKGTVKERVDARNALKKEKDPNVQMQLKLRVMDSFKKAHADAMAKGQLDKAAELAAKCAVRAQEFGIVDPIAAGMTHAQANIGYSKAEVAAATEVAAAAGLTGAAYSPQEAKAFNDLVSLMDETHNLGPGNALKYAKDYAKTTKSMLEKSGLKDVLTVGEAIHIYAYTGSYFRKVNQALRDGILTPTQWNHVTQLNQALDKLPDYKGTVIRRTGGDTFDESVFNKYRVGSVIEERHFTSSSKNPNAWGGKYEFEIRSKTGKYIDPISANKGNEKEVLFRNGTRFRVISKEKTYGGGKIVMEEVGYSKLEFADYNPDQPRNPKGDPDGGKWTRGAVSMDSLKKIGGQKGSNPGGVYENEKGERFYVKEGRSDAHVRNELLAAELYELAGAPTLTYVPIEGGQHVATVMEKLDKNLIHQFNEQELNSVRDHFATHAWASNWDAAGLGGDNQGIVRGVATTLDVGGSLDFRAQGGPKGAAFGDAVTELSTLRDRKMNPDAAGVFGKMSDSQIRASIARVTRISDDAIRAAVERTGVRPDMTARLIARRDYMASWKGTQ